MEQLPAGRITGRRRVMLAWKLADKYRQGASIRTIAEEVGRSFGFVRTLLREAGATIRPRGGDNRQKQ